MKKRNYGVTVWVFKCTSVMQNSHLPSSPSPGEEVSHEEHLENSYLSMEVKP